MFRATHKILRLSLGLALLSLLVTPVWADSSDVIQPIPETGAFSASFREDVGAITIMDFAGNYDKEIDGLPSYEPRAVVAREFYRTHADEYDFLVVFSTFEFDTLDALAFHHRLQNNVQGIGISQYDNGAAFGSGGRLLGYTDMAALTRYVTNPLDPKFEDVLATLGHEILHQWSGNVRFDQGAGLDTALIGKDNAHWSNLLDSNGSVLYGHKWRDNGDGTFTSTANTSFFSPLDLYLSGFYGPNEVPSLTLIENSEVASDITPSRSLLQYGPTISGTTREVTIDDIVAAEGLRLPSVEESQKNFRFAFILLAGANETVAQSQLSEVDRVRRAFVDRFSVWTGGRATANAYPQGLADAQPGSPDVVVGGAPRANSADVSQAFSWLRAQQSLNGFWRDKETTTLRDTVVVTDILARFDASFVREADALDWLAGVENLNTDYLARQARLLQDLGRDNDAVTIRSRLLLQQNVDGGWGIDQSFTSNPLDTALVVLALQGQANVADSVLIRALDFLRAQQNTDGGWSNRAGSPSRTSVTTTVVQALRAAGQVALVADSAIAFLSGKQNPDGGFGDSPSTVHDTSNVLLTLTDLEALGQVRYDDASTYLLTRQTDAGDWAGSTYATALAALTLQRLNIGNWAVNFSGLQPSSPTDGDLVQLSYTVNNDTNQAMPATVVRVLNDGTQIGSDIVVPPLAAGQMNDFSVVWNTFGLAGANSISAIVDPDGNEVETSERDNGVVTDVTVTGAPVGVDFSITADDVAVMPANPALLPTNLGFAVAVRNLGQSDTVGVRVQLREGSLSGVVLEEQIFDIPGRGSIAANFSYQLLDPGMKQFVILVDSDDQYQETRENNNSVVVTLGTENTLDLAVDDADISTATSSTIIGEDVVFSVTLRNRGTLDTPSAAVRYLVTDGVDTTELATNFVQIGAGGVLTQVIVWRADREGAMTFTVQLDPDNLLPELFEDNNNASLNFTGGQANGPNLVVSYLDFGFDPEPGLEGQPLQLTALVRNTGNLAADNVDVGFYDGDPEQGGILIESLQSITSLLPGASTSVNLTWPALPDAQDKLLFVVADRNDTVQEYSETDNQAFNVLTVLSLPDLALSPGDITLSSAFPANGDTVDVTVRVANLGEQSASATVVRIFDGEPGPGASQIGSDLSLDLGGNDSGLVSFSFTLPANGNAMQALYVQLDPDDQILEQTELNNFALREFAVQDGNFVVSQRYISPNGDGVQDSSELFFRLQQTTDVEIVVLDENDAVVRSYTGNEWNAVDGGQLLWDGLDEFGRVVRDGAYRLQVRDTNGPILGSATVTVDNNRSPLLRAEGTEFSTYTNLTCQIDRLGSFDVAADDGSIVFYVYDDTVSLLSGVYRMDGNGTNIQNLYSESDFGSGADLRGVVATNSDLSLLVSVVFTPTGRQHWISDGNGDSLLPLQVASNAEAIGFGPDDQSIILRSGGRIEAAPIDGGAPVLLADYGDDYILRSTLSPNQRQLLLDISNSAANTRRLVLIDIENRSSTELLQQVVPPNDYLDNVHFWPFAWSPDGNQFAVVSSQTREVLVFNSTGGQVNQLPWGDPGAGADIQSLTKPQWSTITDELAFVLVFDVDSNDGADSDQGGIVLVDIEAESVERVYTFPLRQGSGEEGFALSIEGIIDSIIPTANAQNADTFVPSSQFTDFLWAPNERTLLLKAMEFGGSYSRDYPTAAFFLDGDRQPQRVLQVFSNEVRQRYEFSKSAQQLLYNSSREGEDPNSTCEGFSDMWAFRSLLNLTTDLRAIHSDSVGGILLSGSASDANFNRYRLEYAYADNPDVWRPIQPASGQSVIDDQFTVWIPPSPGSYFVRLSASDLAGNEKQRIERVSWSETPAITDLFRAPELFSPNGDGVADVSSIQYRTLTPVHLEFNFYDADGNRVRSVIRDHTEIGQTFQFNWDGRDDDGLLLADGEYRMTVQNYEFFFRIDVGFPEVDFSLQDAYQPREEFDSEGNSLGQFASAQADISWSILDPNYSDSSVEWLSLSNPDSWQLFADPDPVKKTANGRVEGSRRLALSTRNGYLDEVSGRGYRIIAEDGAGNRTVVNPEPLAEQLIVVGFGAHRSNPAPELALQLNTYDTAALAYALERNGGWFDSLSFVPYAEMSNADGSDQAIRSVSGETRFQIKETVFNRLSSLEVIYRLPGETEWRSSTPDRYFDDARLFSPSPIDSSSVGNVDIAYHAVWMPPADFNPDQDYIIRLRGTEAGGREHLSNVFRARISESLSFIGLRRDASGEDQSLIDNLLGGPPTADEYVLWGKVSSADPFTSVRVYVSSNNDPRYAVEREIGVFYNAVNGFAIKTRDLSSCRDYEVRLVGLIESRVDPDSGERLPDRTVESTGAAFALPCLELDVRVNPVIVPVCDSAPPQSLRIEFSPRSSDGAPLQLLTLSTEDDQDVIFNINEPTAAPTSSVGPTVYNYEFILDTGNMAPGNRVFQARLLNANDEVVTQDVSLIIDHVAPQAAISFPAEGTKVCGVPRDVIVEGQSQAFNVTTLEGLVQDDTSMGYFLEFNAGSGYNAATARRFHDSNQDVALDSFEAAQARSNPVYPGSVEASRQIATISPELSGNRKAGSLGELFNISGETTVRLHAYDWGGHHVCTDRVFTFDGDVQVSSVTIDRKLFSPNLDGIADSVEVAYLLEESASLDVEIFVATLGANKQPQIVGNALRVITSDLQVLVGSGQIEWDGNDPGGAPMVDGLYGIRLSFSDTCGNLRREIRYLELDNMAPALNILFPQTSSQLPLMAEIQGTVTDQNLEAYSVEIGSGSDPETWLQIDSGQREITTSQVLGVWNTFGLQGDYTLRVSASDRVGNRTVSLIPLAVTEPLNMISYLEAVEALFSPNGDGLRETSSIRFGLEQQVAASLSIMQGGQVVRELLLDESFDSGPRTLSWNGRDAVDAVVADGVYQVQLSVALASDPLVTQTEEITITVDGSLPTVEITRPVNGFIQPGLPVVGSITDIHLQEYSLSIADADNPAWQEIASGNLGRVDSSLAALSADLDGDYSLRVIAQDLAENRVDEIIPFTIDKTPPEVSLSAPLDNAYVNGQTTVAISGDLVEAYPASYALQFTIVGGNTPIDIVNGTDFPLPPVLAQWDISAVADGVYELSFSVEDLAGNRSSVEQTLTIDKTPPIATINTPQDNGYITVGTRIEGVASDLNFAQYRLEIAPGDPATAEQYSLLGSGDASVDNGQLFEIGVLPLDGAYSLRLRVEDLAGTRSEVLVPVIVDTSAPLPPGNLTAVIENDDDIRLNWSANTEPDLAGYLLFRDGQQITPQPLDALQYIDLAVSQGDHQYTLRAVDNAGNASDDSLPVDIVIDLLPPTVGISAPATGSEVSGLVDIRGTASSPSDFKEYRLYVARTDSPDVRQLLRQSPVPSQAETLAEWNTISLPEGDQYIISLEGEDINGNVATDEVSVSVDNLAPAQPTGLTLAANGDNVSLSWNANVDADVLGYLVFRNDRIANATGTVVGELQPYAIAATAYNDLTLPDGDYSYTIVAIDDAGNLSEASQPATTTIDTRVPRASIVQPEDGIVFEQPQYLLATSEDNDIATMLFQYRAVGDTTWVDLGSDTELPYDFDFNPVALGLVIGDYEVRAVATDQNNQTDANPGIVTLKYRDLTAPTQVIGLQALVDGGDVTLNWLDNSETDLAGYHVDRIDELGNATRLTTALLQTNIYLDAGLADGEHRYQVIAVDLSGNEADVSNDVTAVVYSLQFEPYIVPTALAQISLNGRGVTQATVNATLTNSAGSSNLSPFDTDADGAFVLQTPLESGANTLDLRLVDSAGNSSRTANLNIARGDAPSAPTGLVGTANDDEVSLSWNTNPETNITGYRPYRNGEPALADQAITGLTATASNAFSSTTADKAVDGNPSTYWQTPSPYQDQWIVVEWPEPRLVAEIMLNWGFSFYAATDYDIEADFQGTWVLLDQVRDAPRQLEHGVVLPVAYMTTRIRLTVRQNDFFRLAEITPLAGPLVTGTSFVETVSDGVQQYTLTAVNTLGFESQPSAPAEVSVGDVTPPDAVTLTAVADGSDVDLSWSESTATDIGSYDIYRGGLLLTSITDTTILSFRDLGLPNGSYTYHVLAVDQLGNQSAPSNEETLVMNNPGSFDLSVSSAPAGSALQLNWVAPAGITPTEYRILRGDVAGGPYSEIASVDGSALDYLDVNLQNEIIRYYLVIAVDVSVARSALSFEASGTPLDTAAPNTPVLHSPTRAGDLYFTEENRVTITGSTEAAAEIELIVDGQNLLTTAVVEPEFEYTDIFDFDNAQLSPNGELLVYEHPYSPRMVLYDFATRTEQLLYESPQYPSLNPRWFADGKRIAFIDESSSTFNRFVRIYSLGDASLADATDPAISDITYQQPSPDGMQLVLLGRFDDTGQTGLWLFDLETGDRTLVREGSTWQFPLPQWSPDGERIAFLNRDASPETIEIYEVATTATQVIGQNTTSSDPIDWSPDSKSIVYRHFDSTLGHNVVAGYTLATAQIDLRVADPNIDPRNPQWSPGGDRIAYYDDDFRELRILDVTSGVDSVLSVDGPLDGLEQWGDSGHLLVNVDYIPLRITPPGYFEFTGVSLNLGENEFNAVASDASGNTSLVSDSIVVVRSLGDLPDLSVRPQDVVLLPAAPRVNETVTVGITVHNLGQLGSVPASFSALAIDPAGQSIELITPPVVGSLAPGASQTITANWPLGAQAGEYTLVVVVDGENAIFELSEANNTLIMPQLVSDESGLISTIAMDAAEYASDQTATIMIAISNNGDVFDGRFEIKIEDGQGNIVTQLVDEALPSLAFGGSINRVLEWNTASTFAGDYRAVIRILDDENNLVTNESTDFRINDGFQVDASVTTDRTRYGGNSNLRVTGIVDYTAGNILLDGLSANLRILNGSGDLITETSQPIAALIPGGTTAVSTDWSTGIQPVGLYRVELQVVRGTEVLAQAQSEFVIESESIQVSGSLSLAAAGFGVGALQQAGFEISNAGNTALAQLPVTISLLDSDALTLLQSQTLLVDIDVNDVATGSADFNTTGLALDNYKLLLQVEITDANGQLTLLNLDSASFSLQDRIAPTVTLLQPVDSGLINSADELRFTAEDSSNTIDSAAFQVDAGQWIVAVVRNAANSEYGGSLPALGEGNYTLRARAIDTAGNTGFSETISFSIDNTPPAITIDGVTDGVVYSAPVVPTISVVETNPATTVIALDGEPFVSGTQIAADGQYSLFVDVADLAGNISQAYLSFIIDSSPPVIEISGVVDGQSINSNVTPEITISDENLASSSITLNGESFVSGTTVVAEGEYQLLVSATDLAGLNSSQTIDFRIDLTAPVIIVSEPQDGAIVDTPTIDIIGQTEPAAVVVLTTATAQVSVLTDGLGQFVFDEVALVEGENLFTLAVTDMAGNIGDDVALTVLRLSAQQIELSGSLAVKPRVLAWLPDTQNQNGADLLPLTQLLTELLGQNEIDYKLAADLADFEQALSSQIYNVVLIADGRPDGGDIRTLADQLKLAVAGGIGLVMFSTHPDNSNNLLDITGAQYLGLSSTDGNSQISLIDSPIGEANVLDISERGVVLKNRGGLTVGSHLPDNKPAVVINTYRSGKTALLGFNPSDLADPGETKSLLGNLFDFAAPQTVDLLAGNVVDLQWSVSEVAPPLDVILTQISDARIGLLNAVDGEIEDSQTMRWQRVIETEQDVFRAVIRLPFETGEFLVSADLAENGSVLTSLQVSDLLISTQQGRDDFGADLVATMQATVVQQAKDASRLEAATWLVQAAIDTPLDSIEAVDSALEKLVDAYQELEFMKSEPTEIQAQLGLLYRLYQLERYRLTTGGGQ